MLQTEMIALIGIVSLHTSTLAVASGLTIDSDGINPVVSETGKNITMQWNINLPTGSSIRLIEAYVQFQSKRKTQIITFGIRKPLVSRNGKKHYKNRLIPDLSNSKFTLTITDAKLNDSGNYSLYVISEQPLEEADASVTVYIHGVQYSLGHV